jgi:hypothetical protein
MNNVGLFRRLNPRLTDVIPKKRTHVQLARHKLVRVIRLRALFATESSAPLMSSGYAIEFVTSLLRQFSPLIHRHTLTYGDGIGCRASLGRSVGRSAGRHVAGAAAPRSLLRARRGDCRQRRVRGAFNAIPLPARRRRTSGEKQLLRKADDRRAGKSAGEANDAENETYRC